MANGARKPNKRIEKRFRGNQRARNTTKRIEKHTLGKSRARKPDKKKEKRSAVRTTLCMGKNVKITLGLR